MKLLGLLIFLLLTACSHISVITPVATISPSEISGNAGVNAILEVNPSRTQDITDDASARPPTFDSSNDSSYLSTARLNIGLWDKIQFGLGVTSDIGLVGHLDYQFLGKPWDESSEGFSAATHLKAFYSSTSRSGDQKGVFGPGGYNWKASATLNAIEVGASVGYRWNKSVMGFIGYSINFFNIASNIDQDPNSDGTDHGGSYFYKNNGSSSATGLGFLLGTNAIRISPSVQWVEYTMGGQHERGFWWGGSLVFGN